MELAMAKLTTVVVAVAAALAAGMASAAPFADGFRYTIACSGTPCEFTQMVAAAGFQDLSIWVGGNEVGTVDGGIPFLFAPNVAEFDIRDIVPAVDPQLPGAFPVQLFYNGALTQLSITPLVETPVPSPGPLALLAAAALAGGVARRRAR
jgi:hypothetical protein